MKYKNESIFNGEYSRNNWPKIKKGAYMINLEEYKSITAHWIALYVDGKDITYFGSFDVAHFPKEIKRLIGNKNIRTTNYRIQV